MKTFSQLSELLMAGSMPVVTFTTSAIEDLEGYPERGMRARIVSVTPEQDDMVAVEFDFSEFDAHNMAFESRNYYDKAGAPTLTAREYGAYQSREKFYFMADDALDKYLAFESDARMKLYGLFVVSGSKATYVQWLEGRLLDAVPA